MNKTHHDNAKLVIGMLVILLAAAVFFLFYTYQEEILLAGNFNLFMVLTTAGFALLAGLFYLAANSKHPHKAAPARTKAKAKPATKAKSAAKKKKK